MSQALGLVRRAIQLVVFLMFVVLIATVFYQVLGRYLLNAPPSWSEELARFLQVWIALLASALCIQQGMHQRSFPGSRLNRQEDNDRFYERVVDSYLNGKRQDGG